MDANYLLIVIAAFLIFCAVYGYSKGFLRMVISLVCLVVIIMAVTVIAPKLSDYIIANTSIYNTVRERIVESFSDRNGETSNITEEEQEETIQSFDLPMLITGALLENNTEETYDSLEVHVFEDYISGYLAKMAIKAGTFILLVVVLWIGAYSLILAANFLNKIPVLKTLNRLLGLGTGLAVGTMMVWLLFIAVITFFGEDISAALLKDVSDSQLLTFLFNSNPFFQYVK